MNLPGLSIQPAPTAGQTMPLRPILRYHDARLREVAKPVLQYDASLRELAADLLDTMRAAPGVGITAPHIGIALRVVVIELPDAPEPRYFVNPEIIESSQETMRHEEGSVSMPGVIEEIERPARITLRYRDLEGTERSETAEGFLAICLQHEIDQLDGIFWIGRLSRLKRERVVKRYEKLGRR
jgi:peptide deformylase